MASFERQRYSMAVKVDCCPGISGKHCERLAAQVHATWRTIFQSKGSAFPAIHHSCHIYLVH